MKLCRKCKKPGEFYSGRATCKICYLKRYKGKKVFCIEKKCSGCKKTKSTWAFSKDASTRTGFASYCKLCKNKRALKRYHTSPDYKLIKNLRARVTMAMQGRRKTTQTWDLIGCGIDHLRHYISCQFVGPMSWSNFGQTWEVDHIMPVSLFCMKDEGQQKMCFHYRNLMPLLTEVNRAKRNYLVSYNVEEQSAYFKTWQQRLITGECTIDELKNQFKRDCIWITRPC
jgi:hypothetical protein